MDPVFQRTRRSVHKYKLDRIHQTQQGLERPISDQLDNHQPEADNSEMQSDDKEVLFSQRKKGQDASCAVDTLEKRFFKLQQRLLQNTNGHDNQDCDVQTMESLQRILAGADLLRKEEAAMSILGPKYDFQTDHNSKSFHLPFSYLIRSNSTRVAKCSSNSSKVSLKDVSKGRERSRVDKGKHLDFFEVVKEQLQQKDLENQHLVHLLLVKQQELKDMKEISKQKEKEMQLIAEKLKCEEQKNTEITTRFEHTCEDMRKELSAAKSDNKNSIKKLKALLEKYERLQTRGNKIKDQLSVELSEKKSSQKIVQKLKQLAQELLTKQKHLEEQRDAAARDLALCKETLQRMDAEHKKNLAIKQRLQEELSAMRTESTNLRDYLCKAQEKNKELIQLAHSKESDREKNEKQSQDMIENLNAELEKCRTEKDKVHQQLEAIKHESKSIHNKQNVEILQLQEQQKASLQRSDALRRECETLMEMVNKLKKDKQILTEKLENIHKEKVKSETVSTKEGERLKEAISLLEREREVLLAEMEDLRKDYLGLSDRIAQKMGHMDLADPPMTIKDITSNYLRDVQKNKLSPTDEVIQDIRRKLEDENMQQKLT
ncbi:coiled-coil domain-containing protein 110 [Myxocyprinus asiaticus]|uniref:coiled-coil domain-containing protein 110 n=1 Tax=Myxocyprinus asiaticus TaxID=70543 RepID=UPI002221D69B|nr:coiled-coil domain-containing protein 110 [Myxocyprinus asiaticus]